MRANVRSVLKTIVHTSASELCGLTEIWSSYEWTGISTAWGGCVSQDACFKKCRWEKPRVYFRIYWTCVCTLAMLRYVGLYLTFLQSVTDLMTELLPAFVHRRPTDCSTASRLICCIHVQGLVSVVCSWWAFYNQSTLTVGGQPSSAYKAS